MHSDTMIRKLILPIMIIATSVSTSEVQAEPINKQKKVTIAYTTDVHGNFFPYDFIRLQDAPGSYARVATAIENIRQQEGSENVVLLDNGDILQGQPTVYYYNYIDTITPHIASEIYNFMNVDAATVGNHDIETGHAVYDRVRRGSRTPILAANVIDKATGQPYFEPYTIISRGDMKIAVLGLLTPAIPAWLPENLWSGMRFDPMEETASKWIKIIKEKENPDAIIGLFHSGRDASKTTAGFIENASMTVARNVAGFDAVLMGHDHQTFCDTLHNVSGETVQLLNPANNAMNIGILTLFKNNPDEALKTEARLMDVSSIKPSEKFLEHFAKYKSDVDKFVNREIAQITDSIYTRDAFFGPSAFMTLLHDLQLQITGADISMAAPLTFDGSIAAGPLRIADMFTLYKYENMLSTLQLTGKEIKDYLEYSYSLWIQSPEQSNNPHLINFTSENPTPANNRLKNPSYNFDSAAGIDYTVDITKPKGERVEIKSLSDGRPFDLTSTYTVAVNSYRAGGGGNHLTDGCGLSPEDLKTRVITTTDKDLRYYLMKLVESRQRITPTIDRNWKFIPEEIAMPLIETDKELLFGKNSSKSQK